MRSFLDRLGKEWLFCDGGLGSQLQARGLGGGELPENWNLTHPDIIQDIHRAYLEAGADIIAANTFGANPLKHPDDLREVVEKGVALALEARRRTGRSDAFIALDIGPTGKLLAPMGDLPFEKAVSLFREVILIGAGAGADLILIETMSDIYEAKAAVLAAKESCSLPVCATVTFGADGRLLTGAQPETAVAVLEGLHVDALGVNCGLGPVQMLPVVKRIAEAASVPVIVNPNAGLPRVENETAVYDIGPDEFAASMGRIAELGVQVVGGCCGTTPEHIRRTVETVRALPFRPAVPKHRSVVTAWAGAVEIGPRTLVIGERINPTGKKKFQKALRENDIDYVLSEGLSQEAAGADILDVNVGLPDIDEAAVMAEIVTKLQSILALPLQLDTADPAVLERAMRLYNGKPMINSVNGKKESLQAVLPLVRKYGGVVVGLCLDENGIPDTADGRLAIARRICETAASYGIPKEDILIDGLTMTVSADSRSPRVTLETVRRAKTELGVNTVLGVSNVSFGLPRRPLINAAFLSAAIAEGLSCAIINPESPEMMDAYRASLVLNAQDPQCMGYITACQALLRTPLPASLPDNASAVPQSAATPAAAVSYGTPAPGTSASVLSLSKAIEHGVAGRAQEAAREDLAGGMQPLDLINTELIPALDRVGKGYEQGTLFLPQLLMSADAAKAAFSAVRDSMKGQPGESAGRILLATVRGDIHDIGKNIVKVLLENYGYEVIDLGKDVPPETVADTAVRENVPLVGLSALMTTTLPAMEQTIRLLHERKPGIRVMAGGAVMTQDYADKAGADAYTPDAMAAVRYAGSVFGRKQ
ncbi:MAG: homocysteine S-methyltransferase family protein [Lachnospiraceae bacterium]|jgi:5-methyltetrahydrofolate--homocysteine methyltransferase|nr:homocysteine S-methyltransferase family protein [Lachnospiraceae bacterium]